MKVVATGAVLLAPLAFASTTAQTSLLSDQLAGASNKKAPRTVIQKKQTRMFESLKPVDSRLPDTARRDATAGVFI